MVLLEYMEQHPPLLNRPGMGAKLVTYYRRKEAADTEHQKLKQGGLAFFLSIGMDRGSWPFEI